MKSEDKEFNISKKVYFTLMFIFVVAHVFKFVYSLQGDSIPDMIGQGVILIIAANGFILLVAVDSLKK
jgi:hypothetical protein